MTTILMGVVAVAIIVGMIWLMMRIDRASSQPIERRREAGGPGGSSGRDRAVSHQARAGGIRRRGSGDRRRRDCPRHAPDAVKQQGATIGELMGQLSNLAGGVSALRG